MEDEFKLEPNDRIEAQARQAKDTELDGLPEFNPDLFDPPSADLTPEDTDAIKKAEELQDDKQLSIFLDIPLQAVGGMRDAANAFKDLPIDIGVASAQLFSGEEGDQNIEASGEALKEATDLPDVPESDRTALKLQRGLTQFVAPFAAISKLNQTTKLNKTAQAATAMFNGAITDLAFFDSSEKRLADLAEEFGFENPLAADDDDSAIEARLKTTIEGAGLGYATDGIVKSVRFLREVKRGKTFASDAAERATVRRQDIVKAKTAVEGLADGRTTKVDVGDFRPDKEVIDITTQRRLAEAVGTTVEEIQNGEAFKGLALGKLRNKLNSYTLAEESAFEAFQDEAAEHAFRASQGDKGAREDFVSGLFDVLEVHGAVQDATQDIARAQGFRGNVGAIQDINTIRDLFARSKPDEIDDLMQAVGQAKTTDELRSFLKQIRAGKQVTAESTLREVTERWFMNSILSSPVTLYSDTISNVTFTAYNKLVEKPVAAAIGGLRSLRGGNVTDKVRLRESAVFFQNMMDDAIDGVRLIGRGYNKGGIKGVKQELGEALEATRVENFSRFGKRSRKAFLTDERLETIPAHLQGPAQFISNIANFPTNFMQSKDDVVKGMLYRSAVRERSYRHALNEGLEPGTDAFASRIKELQISPVDNVVENMDSFSKAGAAQFDAAVREFGGDEAAKRLQVQTGSIDEARKLTFTDQPHKISEGVNMIADNLPGGRFIVPFVTTIDNLTRRGFERSPLAGLSPQVRELIASGTAEGDEALARILTGTTFSMAAYGLATQGYITGDGPKDKNSRDAALQAGFRPRSFLINGSYMDFSRQIGPLALMFQIPANIAEIAKHRDGDLDGDLEKDISQYILLGGSAFLNTTLSQSWARGISDLFEAVNAQDEKGAKRMVENLAASLAVPNAATFVANQLNPILQEADSLWERIQIKSGMDVRPKRDVFGEPITRDQYASVFLPANKSDLTEVPEWKVRLYNAGAFPSKPSRRISVGPVSGIQLNANQYERLLEIVGTEPLAGGQTFKEFAESFAMSPAFTEIPAVQTIDGRGKSQAELVKSAYSDVLKQATQILISENPDLQERAISKGLLERTTTGMSPLSHAIGKRLNEVRSEQGIQ